MATNEEDNMRTRTELGLVLEIQNILIAATNKMKKNQEDMLQKLESKIEDNRQNLNEISNRLKSIETLIPDTVIQNKNLEKDDNTANISKKSEKTFTLKHVFKIVNEFEKDVYHFSEDEEHFNAIWYMCVQRQNNHLGIFIRGEPIAPSDEWSIRTKLELKVVGRNQRGIIRTLDCCYDNDEAWGRRNFLEWEDLKEWFLLDGNLQVEAKVTIIETVGLEKERIRKFDESQKDISDVVLVVSDTKFYVSKMFLASQSDVFRALLFGNFKESKQSEVTLNGIDPDDFHFFLEVLYGEFAIDDTTVEGVASLADMYDVPTAVRKCEEFLLKESKRTWKKKLEIATCYHLKNLEEQCISEIEAVQNVRSEVPKDDDHQTKFGFIKVLIDFVFICLFVIVVAIGLSIILIVL